MGVVWYFSETDKSPAPSAPSYSPPASTAAPRYSPQPSQPPRPPTSVSQDEIKPPVGRDLALSEAQIRYCLAEKIRMEGAGATVDNRTEWEVDLFNYMVDDYNSRCGSFRYRRGALESARREVEMKRNQLLAEGGSRIVRIRLR